MPHPKSACLTCVGVSLARHRHPVLFQTREHCPTCGQVRWREPRDFAEGWAGLFFLIGTLGGWVLIAWSILSQETSVWAIAGAVIFGLLGGALLVGLPLHYLGKGWGYLFGKWRIAAEQKRSNPSNH